MGIFILIGRLIKILCIELKVEMNNLAIIPEKPNRINDKLL